MTRATRTLAERHQLAIERAGVVARRYWYVSRLQDAIRSSRKNQQWMWFYLFVQAELMQQGIEA